MKAIAINGSPMMGEGNTALILNPFLAGMTEAGAEVELFYTRELEIGPCQGEIHCLVKTPGKCFQKDDMEMLFPKMAGADLWVLATPVFVDGMCASLKNLIERLLPLVAPSFELREGHSRHLRAVGTSSGKVVLVSSCGFWEIDNFDPLLAHVKAICKNLEREFGGALLRPHGAVIGRMVRSGNVPIPLDDIFQSAKEAGRQLVIDGRMSPETLGIVSRPVLPLEQFMLRANQAYQQMLDAAEKD